MKIIEHSLTIEPAILALTDATASEKLLLALYVAKPDAKNSIAMRALEIGLAGLKKIKRRLIAKGYLRSTAKGYEVLAPGLSPGPKETGATLVPNSSGIEKENKVASLPAWLKKEQSLSESLESHVAVYQQPLRVPGVYSATLEMLSQKLFDFVTYEVPPDCPGRDEALATLTPRRDYGLVADYASDNLPHNYQTKVANLIGKATPEQLAALRNRY